MIKFIKNNLTEIVVLLILGFSIGFFIYTTNQYRKTSVTITFQQEQLIKLKEISKKDFRDVNHTLLMLADDYIKYHENNEVVK
jgi:hypothetical protein